MKDVGYNVRLAAKGYRTLPPESIEKARQKMLGHEVTPETRAKVSAGLKEYYRTHKNAKAGKPMSESQLAKMKELKGPRSARFGKKDSPEVCERRRQSILGKHYKQHKVRRSDGGRNNAAGKRSEETRLRMRWLRLIKRLSGPVLVLQHATGNYF